MMPCMAQTGPPYAAGCVPHPAAQRREKPGIYADIMGNREFVRALAEVLRRFDALMRRVTEVEDRLDSVLRGKGCSLTREGKFTYIQIGAGGRTGRSNYQEFITPLQEELKKAKYRELEHELFNR
jgi:hypothetical protein